MKTALTAFLVMLLSSGILYADGNDSFKGSFGMYDASTEAVVLKKIESQTDPKTEKVMIGGLALKFDYMDSTPDQVDGMQVVYVYFTDKKDKYILTYYVGGNKIVKIALFSKNGDYINKELYPAKNESSSGKKESGK